MHLPTTLLGAALLAATTVAQNTTSGCHSYVIIDTRGTFEKQGPSIGFGGMVNQTLANVTNGIEYDTVYPAVQNQTFYLGSNDIVRFLDAGLQSCPNQKYALLGYSQGASATMQALRNYTDTNSAGYKAIAAIVVIGNPYKTPNKTVDVDENGGAGTRTMRGSLWQATANGVFQTGIPEVFYNDGKLLDICYNGDIVCAPGPSSNLTQHVLYGGNQNVQNMGAQHLITKLKAAVAGTGGSSTNSTTGTGSGSGTPTGAAAGLYVPVALVSMVMGMAMLL